MAINITRQISETNALLEIKTGLFIMIKGSIQQESIIPNVYVSHTRVSKYMKQELTKLKGERENSPITAGELNAPASAMDWTKGKKICRDIEDLNIISSFT